MTTPLTPDEQSELEQLRAAQKIQSHRDELNRLREKIKPHIWKRYIANQKKETIYSMRAFKCAACETTDKENQYCMECVKFTAITSGILVSILLFSISLVLIAAAIVDVHHSGDRLPPIIGSEQRLK